jgi:Zn-dependent protease
MALKTKGSDKKTILGSLGILGVLLLKFKFYIFAGLKALTFLKVGWLISPLISIGFYAMLFGWPYAFAIMVLLFIHELGHYIWMKALGLNPQLPIFVPGIGAYVAMTKLPPDQATHAWVALAGPLVGGLGCTILYWLGVHSGNNWLLAAGSTGFFLNLIQLIPAKPLDGGFVSQAVSKWLLIPGVAIMLAASYMLHSVLLLIISGFSILSLVHQFMTMYKKAEMAKYGGAATEAVQSAPTSSVDETPATVPQRILIAMAYLSLAGILAYLYWLSHNNLVQVVPR